MARTRLTHAQERRIRELHALGETPHQIAKVLGVSYATVRARVDPEWAQRQRDAAAAWRADNREAERARAKRAYDTSPEYRASKLANGDEGASTTSDAAPEPTAQAVAHPRPAEVLSPEQLRAAVRNAVRDPDAVGQLVGHLSACADGDRAVSLRDMLGVAYARGAAETRERMNRARLDGDA